MQLRIKLRAAIRLVELGKHAELQRLDDRRLRGRGIGVRDQRSQRFRHGVARGHDDR